MKVATSQRKKEEDALSIVEHDSYSIEALPQIGGWNRSPWRARFHRIGAEPL
jgi:hypothetical protein